MKSYQPKNIKEHNQALLINILKKSTAEMTKRQLSESSNLSVVTINKLIPELVENKNIIELATPQKTGGRRATAYRFNERRQLLLINQFAEQDNSFIVNFYVVDLLGNIIEKRNLLSVTLNDFLSKINKIKTDYPEIVLSLSGIPGVESHNQLKIMDYEPFVGLKLSEEITKKISVPSFSENDINAATFGYLPSEKFILAGIYFPERFPPGASLVINQHIFKGLNNLSGEIKHLPHLNQVEFPLSNTEIQPQLIATIQTIMAVYDPNEIIIYLPSRWEKYINQKEIISSLTKLFPYDTLPKLTLSHEFIPHYLAGLIKLGLQKIELNEQINH